MPWLIEQETWQMSWSINHIFILYISICKMCIFHSHLQKQKKKYFKQKCIFKAEWFFFILSYFIFLFFFAAHLNKTAVKMPIMLCFFHFEDWFWIDVQKNFCVENFSFFVSTLKWLHLRCHFTDKLMDILSTCVCSWRQWRHFTKKYITTIPFLHLNSFPCPELGDWELSMMK